MSRVTAAAFPKSLKDQIYRWLDENATGDRKPDMTPEQFYYKSRKRAFGPFKKELWSLTDNTRMTLMSELARQFDTLFTKLGIEGSRAVVEKYVKPVAVHHAFPKAGAKKTRAKLEQDFGPRSD